MGGMVSDWRDHAASSELAKLVEQLRPDELDIWLDSAIPRLPETVRLNPCRPDLEWTREKLLQMGAEPIEWYTGKGGAYTLPWEKAKCPDQIVRLQIQSLHQTGRITQQEAASMMPVQALDIQPGHRVLDLCAAPGSKATQIAEVLDGRGLVVANEPNPGRANHLVSNTQRSAHLNMVIVREDGRHFPRVAEPGFDRILVDAPCTGSGTTRKNTDVWSKWTPKHGEHMSRLQIGILSRGALLLRPGGRMVYSTCSIDPQENEDVVEKVLERFPWLSLVEINISNVFPNLKTRPGMTPETESCIRVWSDENDGSGFFIAVFTQTEIEHDSARSTRAHPRDEGREPIPIEPKPLQKKDLRPPMEEDLALFEEWGMDPEGLAMWRRGHYAHVSTEDIREWMWAAPRLTAKNRLYPGGHWQPMRVLQAGQPVWKLRKEHNRLISTGLHGLANLVHQHRFQIEMDLLKRLLSGEEPGRSTLGEQFQNIRDGGILLEYEGEFIPAWIAGKLSLMMADSEQHILRWKLDL
ncbi:MAG: RsmB/NOP family class I SAM-dependent RNA methyltransferase [Candidatus Thermoplasmatota archaeon]|nr:RsmB/NOP family class I SAM-dependent RNA methyltransferase [Candidatus Thermoplasmatota archaeon]